MMWRSRFSAKSSAATARCEPLSRKLLESAQLRQRAAGVELLRRQADAFPQIVDHPRDDEGTGGVHNSQVALWPFDFAAQDSLEQPGVFLHLSAAQISQVRSRNSEPPH